jgi:adenosylmethionine-8-amino-7-oxononanoate aminotransferase
MGTIAAVDLVVEQPGYFNPAGKQVQRLCLEQGVFLRPLGDVIYLLPPLSLNDAQLAHCYRAIEQALEQLA